MAKSSNASAVQNGFLFQVNVAIYLMVKYIKDIDKIRVEGKKEDIELRLTNQGIVFVQVKSQWKNPENRTNVSEKLKSALCSLRLADGDEAKELIYVCNFPDPLCSKDSEFMTYVGITWRRYNELNNSSQASIRKRLQELGINDFNLEKLWIVRIPFFGGDDDEKHKFIYDIVKDFLVSIGDNLSYKTFVSDWESRFLRNGASSLNAVIAKKDILNYLVLSIIERSDAMAYREEIGIDDTDAYADACENYSNFISEEQDRYESICKVLALFRRKGARQKITRSEFVQ